MEFRMLGPLEVTDGGVPVEVKAPKQRAVLAILLIEANRVVSLDRLLDRLYDGEPPPQAVGSVQAYVSHLRHLLEPSRGKNDKPQVLVTRTPGYELRVDRGYFDVACFEDWSAEGQAALRGGRHVEALGLFDKALGLWRGPALVDFAYQAFARTEADRLEELRYLVQESAIEVKLALGRHQEAVVEAEGLLAACPLRERLWASLMLGLYRSGRQGEALAAFQRCRTALDDELGVDPSPALRQLEAEILSQDPSLDWRPARTPTPAGVAQAPPESEELPVETRASGRFVGRTRELDQLAAALESAKAGRGSVVLIGGEAGIGKSAVVEEFARRSCATGCTQAWGVGEEGEGAPAFFIWGQILRELAASDGSFQAALEKAGMGKARLAPLVPGWHSDEAEAPASLGEARFRLYLNVFTLLQSLAESEPLVLFLEDLQWADPASLKLLEFVAARLREASILIVATYRHNETTVDHPLNETLATLARLPGTVRIFPRPLNGTEVSSYLAAVTGASPKEEVVEAILERTDGNPFFLSQLTALLISEHSLDRSTDVRDTPVPAGVGEVIRRRLAKLPRQAAALLAEAAVIGAEFDIQTLGVVSELADDELEEALELAVVFGILVDNPVFPDRFRFSHALIRETLYEGVPKRRRARLHARIADALAQSSAADPAAIAHHFFEAVAVVGIERAVAAVLRAASAAQAALAFERTEELLRRAIALLSAPGRPGEPPGRLRSELLVQGKLMMLLTMIKGYAHPDIEVCAQRMLSLCRTGEADEMETLAALFGLASYHMVKGDFEASGQAGKAMEEAESKTAALHYSVGSAYVEGVVELHTGLLANAEAAFERAVVAADRLPPSPTGWMEVYVHHPGVVARAQLAWSVLLKGQPLRAADLSQEALDLARATGQQFNEVFANWYTALVATLERSDIEVLGYASEAAELARQAGFGLYALMADVLRGFAMVRQVGEGPGLKVMEKALAEVYETGARMMRPLALALLAEAQMLTGAKKEAFVSVEQALIEVSQNKEWFCESEIHRVHGELLANEPDSADRAREALEKAITLSRTQGAVLLEERARSSLSALFGTSSPA